MGDGVDDALWGWYMVRSLAVRFGGGREGWEVGTGGQVGCENRWCALFLG